MPIPTDSILFGAAYYHEYQPTERLDADMDLMKEAHFTVIRVGESVWSTWEPDNGVFDLDWLQPVLDAAHARGIRVILGTPTYAAPPWLARLYPEINVHRSTGRPMGWGVRQEIDYTHPAFLFHAERIIRKIIARYVDHPAVIGFQVDNEPGNEIFHNPGVFQKFIGHLRKQYGTVEELNREWGLTYWSHRLSDWADLWTPDSNAQPQYALAWRRFQAELTTSYIHWQAEVVREYAREDQFVTTCISYERPTAQDDALTSRLDVTAGNPYYRMQDHLALPAVAPTRQSWTTEGTWSVYATADRMFSSKQAPFLVTETNAQAIGHAHQNEPAFDGQWRQAAWALVSRGASMIEYWHWHTLHFGTETFWGGVLPHSLEPGRVYQQIKELGADFAAAGDLVTGLTPDADIVLVYSNDTKWALQENPQLPLPGPDCQPDPRSYEAIFDAFYRGAFEAGLQSRLLHAGQMTDLDPAAYAAAQPVLVAAGLAIASDAELLWLRSYAAAGGHLILGIRTGYQDQEARARLERKPAHLAEAAGLFYDEFSTLAGPVDVVASSSSGSGFTLSPGAAGARWIDGVQVQGAEVLASYDHVHFGRWPAVTTSEHGSGRITYVGTVPNEALARDIVAWAARQGSDWRPNADSQTVTGATSRSGEQLRFVHNWSWTPSSFKLPCAVRDVVSGESFGYGDEFELGAWDVRVLVETK